VSPIFVRPVREQLEHDRLIRFLVAKYKRKFDVAGNVGDEQATPVKIGPSTYFPDLVLTTGRKIAGLVEVESGESVNNLEAMAQWVPFSKVRVPFHLYVPMQAFDAARRFCEANHVRVAEIWTYRATNDGFDLVRMYHDAAASVARTVAAPVAAAKKPAPTPAPAKPAPVKPAPAKVAPAKTVPAKPPAKPAAKPAAAKSAAARKPAKPAPGKTAPAKPAPSKKAKPAKAKSGKR
jgi:hypothetical protein